LIWQACCKGRKCYRSRLGFHQEGPLSVKISFFFAWIFRKDSVVGANKIRIFRRSHLIALEQYAVWSKVDFFPFGMEQYKFRFRGVDCHFVVSKPVGYFLQFSVDCVD
jgi:hypothetical protein